MVKKTQKRYLFVHHVTYIIIITSTFTISLVQICNDYFIYPRYLIIHSVTYIYLIINIYPVVYIIILTITFTFGVVEICRWSNKQTKVLLAKKNIDSIDVRDLMGQQYLMTLTVQSYSLLLTILLLLTYILRSNKKLIKSFISYSK